MDLVIITTTFLRWKWEKRKKNKETQKEENYERRKDSIDVAAQKKKNGEIEDSENKEAKSL